MTLTGCAWNGRVSRRGARRSQAGNSIRKVSFLLLSQDCRQVPQARAKRPLHRFRRTHQVLRAQYVSDQEAAGNRLRYLPEWLKEFTENLEDTEVSAIDHVEPRVQLYVPKKETFPIPQKCIDVTRTQRTRIWT